MNEHDDLAFQREVARRRTDEAQQAETELTAAISRTEAVLSRLRADLETTRANREQGRIRIAELNRLLSARQTAEV